MKTVFSATKARQEQQMADKGKCLTTPQYKGHTPFEVISQILC